MNGLLSYFATRNGRYARIIAGTIIVIAGMTIEYAADSAVGWIVVVVGMVPLLAGMFDFCVFAPLFGLPFIGTQLREALTPESGETVAAELAEDEDAVMEDPADDYVDDDDGYVGDEEYDVEDVEEYAEEDLLD